MLGGTGGRLLGLEAALALGNKSLAWGCIAPPASSSYHDCPDCASSNSVSLRLGHPWTRH